MNLPASSRRVPCSKWSICLLDRRSVRVSAGKRRFPIPGTDLPKKGYARRTAGVSLPSAWIPVLVCTGVP